MMRIAALIVLGIAITFLLALGLATIEATIIQYMVPS